MSSNGYRQLGNVLHILNIASILGYAFSIYRYGNVEDGLFDSEWLRQGFCLPDESTPYQTTHDLSGYYMILLTLSGLAMWQTFFRTSTPTLADNLFFWASVGALGHGFGHLLISNGIRNNYYPAGDITTWDDIKSDSIYWILVKMVPGYFVLWLPLVNTYMMNASRSKVLAFAVAAQLGVLPVPIKFGFAYTQTVLFAGMSIDQLTSVSTEDKGSFDYALWPLFTTLPSTAISWIESTGCTTSPLMRLGAGHVVYDVFMSSSYILYYLACAFVNHHSKYTTSVKITKTKNKSI